MDEFGVLVESIGFKPHGKKSSAPLADLKTSNKSNPTITTTTTTTTSNGFPKDIGLNQSNSSDFDFDFMFPSKPPNPIFDDVFGGFNSYNDVHDDVFGLMKTTSGSGSGSGSGSNAHYHDLLKNNSLSNHEVASEPADLLSGFALKTSSLNGRKSEANPSVQSTKSFSPPAEDPFVMFERTQGSGYQVNNGASVDDYLDSFFSSGARSNTRSSQSSTAEDSVYDALFSNNVVPKKQNKASSVSSNSTKQASSKANSTDDFSYLFGMRVAPPSEEFQEIEGESEERRKARFNHHRTTLERMNNALNEKNKRDLQAQQEQDEKHRVAATLEGDIKRWAVGKEGNLRALLSSLQHILWAGSGWQPISLTDLITSTAVKKAYYKATLCVHPDKVQQKGASVQQKYIAEKVFDLLKESWNKFNAEEFKRQ